MKQHSPTDPFAPRMAILAPVMTILAAALTILALSMMTFSAHAQNNPMFRHIPPEAGSVTDFNLGAIGAKLNWEDLIKNIPLGKKMGAFEDAIKDPTSVGLDLHGEFLIAGTNNGLMDSTRYTTFIAHVTDSSKFRQFVHQQFKDSRVKRYPDKSFSIISKNTCIAWNNELAIVVLVQPSMKEMMGAWGDKSKGARNEPGKPRPQAQDRPDQSLAALQKCLAVMKGFTNTYFTTDPIFKAQFSNDADIHMCNVRGGYLQGLTKMFPHGAMGGLQPEAMDMFSRKFTEVRFEPGKISISGRLILKPDMAAKMEKLSTPPLNTDLIARLPAGNLLGIASIRLDFSLIGEMMEKFGVRQKFDSAMTAKGVNPADLGNALKGELLVAAIGTDRKDSSGKPKPSIYFVAPIKDMSALHNLGQELEKVAARDSAKADADSGDRAHKKPNPLAHIVDHSAVQDGLLVISGSKEQSEGYFSNTQRRNTDFVTDHLKESPSFVWIDLKAIVSYLNGILAGKDGQEKTLKLLEKLQGLDKLIFSGGALHNGEINTSFELLIDSKENGLKALLDMVH